MSRTVTRCTIAALAVVIAATGCGDNVRDGNQSSPTRVARPLLESRTSQYAADVLATFTTLPTPTRLGPVPCGDRGGDLADDGSYQVSGSWQIPLPSGQQRATFQRLRTEWQAKGVEITEYRELSDGVKVSMAGRDPAAGFTLTLTSTQPPEAVALLVVSSCALSPDGRYPG